MQRVRHELAPKWLGICQVCCFLLLSLAVVTAIGQATTLADTLDRSLTTLSEPGGGPDDVKLAVTNPNEYAWHLFFFLNRQAKTSSAGVPDQSKATFREYDQDRAVVWETWALASGLNVDFVSRPAKVISDKSEIFAMPATMPVAWESLDRTDPTAKVLSPNLKNLFINFSSLLVLQTMSAHNFIHPVGTNPGDQEVRMNRSTYDSIREKHLYSVEGIQTAVQDAKTVGRRSFAVVPCAETNS